MTKASRTVFRRKDLLRVPEIKAKCLSVKTDSYKLVFCSQGNNPSKENHLLVYSAERSRIEIQTPHH